MRLSLLDVMLLVVYLLTTVGGMTLIKLGSATSRFGVGPPLLVELDVRMIAGLVLFFLSFLLWVGIIARYELSYVAPLLVGGAQLLILASAVFIIGERPTSTQLAGAFVVIAGVVLMNVSRTSS